MKDPGCNTLYKVLAKQFHLQKAKRKNRTNQYKEITSRKADKIVSKSEMFVLFSFENLLLWKLLIKLCWPEFCLQSKESS